MKFFQFEPKNNFQILIRKLFYKISERITPTESVLLGAAAVMVGLTSGAGVWLFKKMIGWVELFFTNTVGVSMTSWGSWTPALFPVMGGLLVGVIIHVFIGQERYHGVAGIMEAVALGGGRLRYLRMPIKAIASAVSIGSGASVGPEDPSVQIGANLGSFFGQLWKLSPERIRTLVAAGAAGGIAAAFNAPIAGIFFSLEIILGELSGSALGVVVLASVISSVFTQAVSGASPAFHVPAYGYYSPMELPFYLGLGILAGAISAAYIYLLDKIKSLFHQLTIPNWGKPALAGVFVGITGLFLPQIFGVGYSTIEFVLGQRPIVLSVMLLVLLAKLILTPISIGGGFQGGVFAPALFLGAVLGGVYGTLLEGVIPDFTLARQAFAMVGMAAVLAGAVRAPMTAILLLFEMTNDYRIILPLMLGVVVSVLVSSRLQKESVYTLALVKRGVRLRYGRDIEVLQALTVSEVMRPVTELLNTHDTIMDASEKLWQTHLHGLPVVDSNRILIGMLTLEDIQKNAGKDNQSTFVGDICTRQLLVTFPDETLGTALRRMGIRDIGQLPVVHREGSRQLLGLLTRADIVRAYDSALVKVTAARHKVQQARLGMVAEAGIEEIIVEEASPCDGQKMKEIDWPRDCVIASLRRGQKLMIPRGETQLKAGDVLLAVVEEEARSKLYDLCKTSLDQSNFIEVNS